MKPDQDWEAVWPATRTFHPASVPLPVRQGATQTKSQVICTSGKILYRALIFCSTVTIIIHNMYYRKVA